MYFAKRRGKAHANFQSEELVGRSRSRLKFNIKIGLIIIKWNGVDWLNLAQDGVHSESG
jgi:hypothetical protein